MRKKQSERGATILESLLCIILLCMIFFGLMQIFQWSMAKMLTEYSSFYAAKAHGLGYSNRIVERATRVAITGASGQDMSAIPAVIAASASNATRQSILSEYAEEYMRYGQEGAHGVRYEYWEDEYTSINSNLPHISIGHSTLSGDVSWGRVEVTHMPLLSESIGILFGGITELNPRGTTRSFNHASLYLEND